MLCYFQCQMPMFQMSQMLWLDLRVLSMSNCCLLVLFTVVMKMVSILWDFTSLSEFENSQVVSSCLNLVWKACLSWLLLSLSEDINFILNSIFRDCFKYVLYFFLHVSITSVIFWLYYSHTSGCQKCVKSQPFFPRDSWSVSTSKIGKCGSSADVAIVYHCWVVLSVVFVFTVFFCFYDVYI